MPSKQMRAAPSVPVVECPNDEAIAEFIRDKQSRHLAADQRTLLNNHFLRCDRCRTTMQQALDWTDSFSKPGSSTHVLVRGRNGPRLPAP